MTWSRSSSNLASTKTAFTLFSANKLRPKCNKNRKKKLQEPSGDLNPRSKPGDGKLTLDIIINQGTTLALVKNKEQKYRKGKLTFILSKTFNFHTIHPKNQKKEYKITETN